MCMPFQELASSADESSSVAGRGNRLMSLKWGLYNLSFPLPPSVPWSADLRNAKWAELMGNSFSFTPYNILYFMDD